MAQQSHTACRRDFIGRPQPATAYAFPLGQARNLAADLEGKVMAIRGWHAILCHRLNSGKPIDEAAADVLCRILMSMCDEAGKLDKIAGGFARVIVRGQG